MIDSWLAGEFKKKKMEAVQETLPQVREKPVAGLEPVSRQRTETFLPSEKEEGSNVETQKQLSTFSLHLKQSVVLHQPCEMKREKGKWLPEPGSKNHV